MTETQPEPIYTLKDNLMWYASLGLIFLFICASFMLCSIFYLAQVPDITWEHEDVAYTRIFLVRSRGPVGIAYQTQRMGETTEQGEVCVTTKVRYLLWKNAPDIQNQNAETRLIYLNTATGWQPTGKICP